MAIGDKLVNLEDLKTVRDSLVTNEIGNLKSVFDNNSDFFLVPETFATTPNRASALNPLTGGNGSYVGFRTGYLSYNKPLRITFNEDGYKFVVWTYSTNSTTDAVFAPVKNYVRGTLYLRTVTGTNPCFRIGVIKDSGEAFTEEEAVTTYAKIQYRSQTDNTLLLENVPADAKIVGDKVTVIESDINEINTVLVENGKNIVNHHADESGTTSSGLNYSCENDVWTIEGENGDSIWFRTVAGSADAFPFGLKAGDTVKLYASVLKNTNVYMAFRPYKNGSPLTAYQYDKDVKYTIPSDADAMQIRIEVPKNRTVTTTVTYKPEVRITDTNKELETRVEAIENTEQADNSLNVIKPFNREETISKGLTYSAADGVLTISGTATNSWYTVVGGSDTKLPDGIESGKTYFFWLDGPEGLRLSLYSFPGTNNIFETSSFGYFTIPSDATAIQIRIRVPNGQVIPQGTIVYPYIGKNIPNVSLKTMFGFRSEKPMLTIIDDDGNNKFYTKLLPIIIEKNIPITSATVCGYIDNPSDHSSMTWEQVVECYQKGAEIVSHTMTHVTGDASESMTELEIERDYRMARNVLASHGIPTNILVFAGNSGNVDKCQNAARKTYDYAFHSDGGKVIKQNNFRPFYIQRYGIGISSFAMQAGETVPSVPKGYIDNCIANPGWIIWMIHTSSGDWTDAQVNGIKASIDYALSNGVEIVTCEYALKQFVKA